MPPLGPLRFRPLLKRAIWGGRRLETLLGKSLGPGADFAESWELVDHGADQSVVVGGPHAGQTLADLLRNHAAQLLGPHAPRAISGQDTPSIGGRPTFPLLVKFLDAHQPLSVQVHPDDAFGARLQPPDLGKTEAWVVVHAEPGSVIYAGLKRGFDRHAFEREVARGTTELCLHRLEPRVGDCFLIPAGTVHALGAGLVIAEVQQSSDSTFRLFDWNRVGADGLPRALHLTQAMEAIDFERGPIHAQIPQADAHLPVEHLVACDKFVIDRWCLQSPQTLGGDGRFHILIVLEGLLTVEQDPVREPVARGGTVLLPADTGPVSIAPIEPTVFLDAYLPP